MRLYLLIPLLLTFLEGITQDCSDLFISEYIEGSSNNKCLEIYNPTPGSIDLSSYMLKFYFNGNTSAGNTIGLTGIIPSKSVFVICDDNASMAFQEKADLLAGGVFFNGDDAIVLFKGVDTLDIFGKIGMDPGTAWSGGGVTTLNQTLVRIMTVFEGVKNNPPIFNPSVEWSQHVLDFTDSLGMHFTTPCQAIILSKSVAKGLTGLNCSGVLPTADLLYARPGDSVCYYFQVINAGETTLTMHDLADDHLGTLFSGLNLTLSPGQSHHVHKKDQFNASHVNRAIWTARESEGALNSVTATDSARVLETRFPCLEIAASFNYLPTSVCSGEPSLTPVITGRPGIFTYRSVQGGPKLDINSQDGTVKPITSDVGTYEIINTVESCGKLLMTGILEGDMTGGLPKAIEFKVLDDISDLSVYGLGIANNGGGSDGIEYNFPAQAYPAGTYLYLASEADSFDVFFGFRPQLQFSGLNFNGDDAIELFCHNQVIDVFGDINNDGTGSQWEYTNGWAYRQVNQAPNNGIFVVPEWCYSGPGALENIRNNSQAGQPFPYGSYVTNFCSFCEDHLFKDTINIYQIPFDHPNCISKLNVALGSTCDKTILPNEVLLNIDPVCSNGFRVDIYKNKKNIGSTIGLTEIGQNMIYRVVDEISGQSCWGSVSVQNELPINFLCADTTIYCTDSLPALPIEKNQCLITKLEIIGIKWFPYPCDSINRSGYFLRTFRLSSIYQNEQICSHKIYVRRENLMQITCPPEVIIDCGNPLLNSFIFSEFDHDGFAHPKPFIIQNINIGLVDPPKIDNRFITEYINKCEIIALYDDVILPSCGESYIIKRTWSIKDWCTDLTAGCEQFIYIRDSLGPIPDTLKNIDTLIASIPLNECKAEVLVPVPLIKSECTPRDQIKIEYFLEYSDENNKTILIQGQSSYLDEVRLYLPIGHHPLIFSFTDQCWNTSYDTILVLVTDSIRPVPICHQSINVSIDDHCQSKIYARDLDKGSFDLCCDDLHFAVAQMDSINYWIAYWYATFKSCLGVENFDRHRLEIDALVDEWLNCFVFKDGLDLKTCGNDSLVLRVYEACDASPYDKHYFKGSEHQWFMYQVSDRFACWYTWNFNPDPYYVLPRPELYCDYQQTVVMDWDVPYTTFYFQSECSEKPILGPHLDQIGQPNLVACSFESPQCNDSPNDVLYHKWTSGLADEDISYLKKLKTYRFHFNHAWNDCMVEINLASKLKLQCMTGDDRIVFADGVPVYVWTNGFSTAKNQIAECLASDSIPLQINNHSEDTCLTYWKDGENSLPVFCQSWINLDKYDGVRGAISQDLSDIYAYSVSPACLDFKIDSVDSGVLNECNSGVLVRSWTIRDICGNNETVCHQGIRVLPRSDFVVCFPPDTIIYCSANAGELISYPTIEDDDIELLGISYEDNYFQTNIDLKDQIVLRTWKIIDWCTYNPDVVNRRPDIIFDPSKKSGGNRLCTFRSLKDNGDGYLEYTQHILIKDTIPPVVYCIQDLRVCSEECHADIKDLLIGIGEDQCITSSGLDYWYTLTGPDTGVMVIKGVGNRINRKLPIGNYSGTLYAKDHSGLIGLCPFGLIVADCQAPTPYCFSNLSTVIVPPEGQVTVWAKDLDMGSKDDCTDQKSLKITFDEAGAETYKVFTCLDVQSKTIPLSLWIQDNWGNKNYCQVNLAIQSGKDNPCDNLNPIASSDENKIELEKLEDNNFNSFISEEGRPLLMQNNPNPFGDQTEIIFYIPTLDRTELEVFDLHGKILFHQSNTQVKGWHKVKISGLRDTGVFYYRLKHGNHSLVKRMMGI